MLACWDNGSSLIARFIGPIWGRSGADRTQVGPMLVNELCHLGCLLAPVGGVLVVSHYSQLTATHSVMGTYRYYLRVHELHMSCSNFTEWQGPPPQLSSPSDGHQVDMLCWLHSSISMNELLVYHILAWMTYSYRNKFVSACNLNILNNRVLQVRAILSR